MSQQIRIGVVEDNVIIADSICAMLEESGYSVFAPCGSYSAALELVERERPDLMVLDIRLGKGLDGIELAGYLRKHYEIPFIFLTANSDTATVDRAKACRPNAYLVKPFQKSDLYTAIEIAFHNFREHTSGTMVENTGAIKAPLPDMLFIKDGTYFHKVLFDDILYLSSEHVYVTVHTVGRKKFLVRTAMQQYLEKFNPDTFLRVHRSYAVNIGKVDKINATCLVIAGDEIPISKNYREELMTRLKTVL